MDLTTHYTLQEDALIVRTAVSLTEMRAFALGLETLLYNRICDTLYAELLPVLRERVGAALNAAHIAKCLEDEISAAVHCALGNE